jgi:hypothetical protein
VNREKEKMIYLRWWNNRKSFKDGLKRDRGAAME